MTTRRAGEKGGYLRLPLRGAEGRAQRAGSPARIVLATAIALVAASSLVLVVLGPANLLVRAAVLAIALGAAFLLACVLRRPAPPAESAKPLLIVDDLGLSVARPHGRIERLMPLRPAFGVSLLTSAARDKVVLALTSPERLICVGADIPSAGPDRGRLLALIPFAVTVSGDDLVMSTILPDHTVLVLSASSWLRLFDALVALDATALDRCYLSDSRGGQIAWTGDRLRTSQRVFRLDQPFEWRAWAFQEADMGLGAAFQATSVRQGPHEAVFVCLLGPDVRASIHDAAQHREASVDSFLLRDAHLSEATAGAPPPRDRRIAIDRLFMLSLRRALDRAQCENRPSVPGDASAP